MKARKSRAAHRGAGGRLTSEDRRPALIIAWERTLRRHADRRAIVQAADGEACTFGELDARATAWLAAQRFPAGALAGRAVVFAVPNGIRWFEIFLGLMRAQAIAVPLDAAEPIAAQRQLADRLRAAFWWNGERLVPAANPRRVLRDVRLFKLTSGTTGEPRALAFTDAQLLADAHQVTRTMGIRATDLNYALIPFGHSYGLGNLTLPLLAHGVPLVCGAAALPQAIAADFSRWRPTVFPSVPAVFRALVAAEIEPSALASLRRAISAGAPLPVEVARAFAEKFGQRIHAFYGSSETGGIAYDRMGGATLAGGVGTPLRGVQIASLPGRRLRISSAAVFTVGNTRRVGAHGAWTPPDRAEIDHRGRITLLGRRGTTVKIAGRRVNLAEVAARLRRMAGVRDVWIAATRGTDPVIGAALVTNRRVGELRAELQADTAGWKIPRKWAVLEEFPLTARGKIDVRTLHAHVFGPK